MLHLWWRDANPIPQNNHTDFYYQTLSPNVTEEGHMLQMRESVTTPNKRVGNDAYLRQLPLVSRSAGPLLTSEATLAVHHPQKLVVKLSAVPV